MDKAVCNLSVVPLRTTASEKSEMSSQMLFGETCTILDINKSWALIRTDFDQYEGWCNIQQIDSQSNDSNSNASHVVVSKTAILQTVDQTEKILSFGSSISSHHSYAGSISKILSGELRPFEQSFNMEQLISDAIKFSDAPYLWGGRSIFGLDCSGFIQVLFKANGKVLPRDAYQQAELGTTINFIDEANNGDLLFFDNENGQIVHVGLLINGNNVIHASGCVRIDPVDHFGIFNAAKGEYSHRLRIIKRI